MDLQSKIDSSEGQYSIYPFLREYAIVLHSLGRVNEAISAINRGLENTSSGFSLVEREQLSLLMGIILGASSQNGREVLEELIRSGRNLEVMGIALQLLARSPEKEDALLEFLKEIISRTEPHPFLVSCIIYEASWL